ncbi:Uncharacterised protein [uncultured archaeon]|nr:Uncharacterised protein [uncultured archaeon]
MIIKKIFEKNFDDEVHGDFLKFGKGDFKDKYLIECKRSAGKLSVKTGPEFANYLVRKGLEKANGKVSVSGVIVSTLQLDIPISKGIKQFMGVKQYQVSGEIDSKQILELMNKYPRAFFALTFNLPDYELKIKPKAPKSAKPSTSGQKEPKAEFCSLKTSDKSFEKEFLFDVNQDFKEVSIKHLLKITDMMYPKDFAKMKPEEVRAQSKRKGILVRELNIDGKIEKREAPFEA